MRPSAFCRRQSAAVLVEQLVSSNTVVGIDSGDLCTAVIQEIGAALQRGDVAGVRVIAASDAAASEAAFVGVPQALSADVEEVLLSRPLPCLIRCPTREGWPHVPLAIVQAATHTHSTWRSRACEPSAAMRMTTRRQRLGRAAERSMQIDVVFAEADQVDIESASLPFLIGAKSLPAQPQLPRLRAAAKKARTFVALLPSEKQV